jgi:glycosyltransferase involved in cell wall biosynthesis
LLHTKSQLRRREIASYNPMPMSAKLPHGRPIFSVVIPTFNRSEDVLRAVGSVLAQTCGNFEVVVADDGSSDGTAEALRTINDPRVRVLELPHRAASAARNAGLSTSNGAYVAFLDSDDTVESEWLAEFAGQLHAPAPALVRCGSLITGPQAEHTRVDLPGEGSACYPYGTCLAGTYTVDRTLLQRVGGFTEQLSYAENTELLIRVMAAAERLGTPVRTIAKPLVRVHQRRDGAVEYGSAPGEAAEYVLRHHWDCMKSDRSLLSDYLAIAGTASLRAGRRRSAAGAFARAWLARPTVRGALRFALLAAPRSVVRARARTT